MLSVSHRNTNSRMILASSRRIFNPWGTWYDWTWWQLNNWSRYVRRWSQWLRCLKSSPCRNSLIRFGSVCCFAIYCERCQHRLRSWIDPARSLRPGYVIWDFQIHGRLQSNAVHLSHDSLQRWNQFERFSVSLHRSVRHLLTVRCVRTYQTLPGTTSQPTANDIPVVSSAYWLIAHTSFHHWPLSNAFLRHSPTGTLVRSFVHLFMK